MYYDNREYNYSTQIIGENYMGNPVVKTLDTDWTWVEVATAITLAGLHVVNTRPYYYRTYRLTGESAPTDPTEGTIPDEAIEIFVTTTEELIRANEAIDVYLFCNNLSSTSTQVGKVVVDA